MAGKRNVGPLGTSTNKPSIDSGTLTLTASPQPGSICGSNSAASKNTTNHSWGLWQTIRWKVLPEWIGGDRKLLRAFKDAWVKDNASTIKSLATTHDIPPLLLAGVAWIEVGGDPEWIDSIAFAVRQFDHSGDPALEPLTITKKPQLTSLGDVSIQLRRAAEALGLNYENMNSAQRSELIECLSSEETNLTIVARHLAQLRQVDYPYSMIWGDDQIRVVGSRYNRGPSLALQAIRQNTSYGDFILNNKAHILSLLE